MEMPETTASLDVVLARYALLNTENERLLDRLRQQERELAEFRGQDADQAELELLLNLQKVEVQRQVAELPKPEPEPKKQRGHGPTPQPELPVVVLEHVLPESERTCLFCGHETVAPMGLQSEDTEEITIEMKRVVRLVHRRQKYRCSCNGAVVTGSQASSPAGTWRSLLVGFRGLGGDLEGRRSLAASSAGERATP